MESSGLWRLIARDGERCCGMRGQAGGRLRAEVVPKRCSGAIVMAERTCKGLCEATDARVCSWAALPQSRGSGCSSWNSDAHISPRRVGGARIGAVRARISMTIIGAPQCRQMKAGRVSMTVS